MNIPIRIVSDPICPFCFIGYRKLLQAQQTFLKTNPSTTFSVKFEPFLLDPTLTNEPVKRSDKLAAKFGPERAKSLTAQMIEYGKPWDIHFSYSDKATMRSTIPAHRLLTLAHAKAGQSAQLALHERLFQGYFEQEQDIGDPDFLASSAASAGLGSVDDLKAFLQGTEHMDEVQSKVREARDMGVSGVPFFIVGEKYAVEGAQDPEVLVGVFEKLAANSG